MPPDIFGKAILLLGCLTIIVCEVWAVGIVVQMEWESWRQRRRERLWRRQRDG